MKKWELYTTSQIKPEGWMRDQLRIQAEGLSGNLHKMWRDVRDSSWIGGGAEGWERVPYWLDGFVPLAYLLEDEQMIAVAKKYIDAIIGFQQDDGWICPCEAEKRAEYDHWALILITKTLTVYYECSGDERIPKVVYRILKNFYDLLKSGEIKLFNWGKFRWFESFIAINFIYARYREEWLIELAHIVREQGANYRDFTEKWKHPMYWWRWETHIVNLAMMLKYEAVSCDMLGEKYIDIAEELHGVLSKYNGTPVGLFTGDECLSGLSPIHGTELCAVVEQMYSYELLYAYTGDRKWAERLEVLAFNALPATISDDMWTHQYVQLSNQIACKRFPGRSLFGSNGSEAHLFGLEPNYGCCTANLHQGWPKLALSAYMHAEGEVINVLPIPSRLESEELSVVLKTDYPFKNSFCYRLEAKTDINFTVRIPGFALSLKVDGRSVPTADVKVSLKAGECRDMTVEFETVPYFEDRPYGLVSAKCGSLVFSLPIEFETQMYEYERSGVERKFPYCDYELLPTSDWEYAYSADRLEIENRELGEVPFSSKTPAVVLRATVSPIDWGLERGYDSVCAEVPRSLEPAGESREIELWPYGCAKLRMTEMPKIK